MNKSRQIAFGGIMAALLAICVILINFVPTGKLSLYGMTLLGMMIVIREGGLKMGMITLFASAGVAFLIVPNKLLVLPFVIFFGVYPIVKYAAEWRVGKKIAWLFKILFVSGIAAFSWLFLVNFITETFPMRLPVYVILLVLIPVTVPLDILFDEVMRLYEKNIRPRLNLRG